MEVHVIVSGRVQMVMFRDFAERKARSLKITGTVQNLKDKTVEIIVQGEKETLEKYLTLLRKASILSRVDSVRVEWREPTQKFNDFIIVY